MCGIFSCLYCEVCNKKLRDAVKESANICIIRRGPDSVRSYSTRHGDVTLDLVGSVLNMRPPLTPQPISNDKGDVLVWNGELFGGLQCELAGNDTKLVLHKLSSATSHSDVLSCVSLLHGPWALAYWQQSTGELWFGRDVFGRRSLLWHLPVDNKDCFTLSSAAQHHKSLPEGFWTEVPAYGLYCLTVSTLSLENASITFYPWIQAGIMYQDDVDHMIQQCSSRTCLKMSLTQNHHLSVSFPSMNKTLPLTDDSSVAAQPSGVTSSDAACKPASGRSSNATKLLDVLQEAVMKRVTLIPQDCVPHQAGQDHPNLSHSAAYNQAAMHSNAKVAILFSGGVDSMVLAALADRCLHPSEPIDLINVAFEQKKTIDNDDCYNVPDRITAVASLLELNPNRTWNLILVNVNTEELSVQRDATIRHLVHPLCTVLDDSIGCALWFAARGWGYLHPSQQLYQSSAKCVLVGIGADEQLAGYARHRTKFRNYGWEGLVAEVEMDVKRISHRNLGRDDRCIGDHSREARFPFLDEDVVSFLQSIVMSDKVDFSLPRGEGEKCLLREVARSLGCVMSSRLPKRAIQFGSRIAKLEGNSKEVASDVCHRLTDKH